MDKALFRYKLGSEAAPFLHDFAAFKQINIHRLGRWMFIFAP
jgi:hypothetical protein